MKKSEIYGLTAPDQTMTYFDTQVDKYRNHYANEIELTPFRDDDYDCEHSVYVLFFGRREDLYNPDKWPMAWEQGDHYQIIDFNGDIVELTDDQRNDVWNYIYNYF